MSMPGGVRGGDREESPYSIVSVIAPCGFRDTSDAVQ
jgi:hypothetical protein